MSYYEVIIGYYEVIMGYSGLLWVIPGYYGVLSYRSSLLGAAARLRASFSLERVITQSSR